MIEGDEYDTAYFDKGPKFLHYRPRTAILTSVEFDHADIFRDLPHYEAAFERFVRLLPAGRLPRGERGVPERAPDRAGLGRPRRDLRAPGDAECAAGPRLHRDGSGPRPGGRPLRRPGAWPPARGRDPAGGRAHNVENALGVVAAARALGLEFEEIAPGLATFAGVRRRQEVRGEVGGVVVIDDFAHHPTAVRATIDAIRARFPGRRLWAAFEPRSNTSRRRLHQREYVEALAGAACVALKVPEPHDMVPADQRLDADQVVADLRARGVDARAEADVDQLVRAVADGARPGDVVLVMSNGAFGGFIDRLLTALRSPR